MRNIDKIINLAEDIFGSFERAKDWTEQFSLTLGDSPVNLSVSDAGTEKVLLHLAGISRHYHD